MKMLHSKIDRLWNRHKREKHFGHAWVIIDWLINLSGLSIDHSCDNDFILRKEFRVWNKLTCKDQASSYIPASNASIVQKHVFYS